MRRLLLTFLISIIALGNAVTSDLVEVLPLTDKVLMLHFDDGVVNYPSDLQVDRLSVSDAEMLTSYTISSADDPNFSDGVNPVEVGRKTKAEQFVKDVPWNNDKGAGDPTGKPWASDHWLYLVLDNPMISGNTYKINTGTLAANGEEWTFTFNEKELRSEAVHVNTIGYAADAPKYGYVYQWMGDLGNLDLTAYDGNQYWVFEVSDMSTPVKTGTLSKRKGALNPETGQPDDTPNRNFVGAEVYECELTDVNTNGEYVLVVEGIGKSYPFKIGDDALWEAYYACGRALYYQRSGIRLEPPYTDGDYIRPVTQNTKVTSDDGTDFSGLLLYSDYPYMSWTAENGGDAQDQVKAAAEGNPIDVAGWYHDAGDWDAYESHQKIPIMLMLTYEFAPERFADNDLNLPESGNGIPDIIDEASWLIKFNYRMRKELMAKGYSDGGVGGARVCPDVYSGEDGNAQKNKPSWQDHRRYVVTQADAFMTYYYAGQAAQFAYILKQLGKDPSNFPVEMLDAVDYADMSYDQVNWIQEAVDAYEWASDPDNQPASDNNYDPLPAYKMYAAASLYRLTGEQKYHDVAKAELEAVKNETKLNENQPWGIYTYLLTDNYDVDKVLQDDLLNTAIASAKWNGLNAAPKRAMRWGSVWDMPMLIGQGTTPRVFENIIAYELTNDKKFKDVVHTTADYFLGTNPLHTTWATHVGPRPAQAGFHLDSRYNNDWELYPGFVPYGPWSMAYGYDPVTYTIDGRTLEGGKGTWNKDWHNFSVYPKMDQWPGHERYCNNIHAPLSSENTVHQNTVNVHLTYGYVNSRHNKNAEMTEQISNITLNESVLTLTAPGEMDSLIATIDNDMAEFGELKWTSSDSRIAHVDGLGRVTGVTKGSATITCSALDGSASVSCDVTCDWTETDVQGISLEYDTLSLIEGQSRVINITFDPADATNQFVDWYYTPEGIVEIDENNILNTVGTGNAEVVAVSLNGAKKDTMFVEVIEAVDYTLLDFDEVVPVEDAPQADSAQIFASGEGQVDIDADNPMVNSANPSGLSVKYMKPAGTWRLMGFVLPTDSLQDLSQYSQFQFKYYGKDVKELYIKLGMTNGSEPEITVPVDGKDCWQLFSWDLPSSDTLERVLVFVNPSDGNEMECFFDDFQLTGKAAVPYNNISLSTAFLEIKAGEIASISADAEGHPYSFVSSNPGIATVDQTGKIVGIASGETEIMAVPLYGTPISCTVKISGGCPPVPPVADPEMLLDFEGYPLDWSQGYGVYAWATNVVSKEANPSVDDYNNSANVVKWVRDGSSSGGGFGVQFPMSNTKDYTLLTMQVYPTAPIETIGVDILNGDAELATVKGENLNLPANQWSNVQIDMSDAGISNTDFNKFNFLMALGTEDAMDVYVDNVQLGAAFFHVESIELNESSITLFPSETFALMASLFPEKATDPCVEWSSSDETVVTVTDEGIVEAVGEGTAQITATSRDMNKTATCDVTVAYSSDATLADLTVNGTTVEGFESSKLTYDMALPAGTVDVPDVAASTSDENASFKVTDASAVPGTTIVEVTAQDGETTATYEVNFTVETGILVSKVESISLYPNPAGEKVFIESDSRILSVCVKDLTGRTIIHQNGLNQTRIDLDLNNVMKGTYLIHITDEKGHVYLGKFLKR